MTFVAISWRAPDVTTGPEAMDGPNPGGISRPPPGSDSGAVSADDWISARHLHPLSPLSTWVVAAVRIWPLWLIALTRSAGPLLVTVAAALLAWRFVVWFRTTYEVGPEGLVIRSGVWWRTVQTVPPQRIQQVDQRRGIRHQALGLVELRLGLAGTGQVNEVSLDSLGEGDAERLATMLDRWRRHGPESPVGDHTGSGVWSPPEPAAVTLLRLNTRQLVIAGLTSRSLWLAPLAAAAVSFQVLSDLGLVEESQSTVQRGLAAMSPALVLMVLLAVVSVASVGFTVLSHFNLTVERRGSQVGVRRGLLEVRHATLPLGRVQVVRVGTNPIRRRLGLGTLDVRTADLGGDIGAGLHSASVPIGDLDELTGLTRVLLSAVAPADAPDPLMRRHRRNATRRAMVRRTIRIVPPVAVMAWVFAGAAGLALIPIAFSIAVMSGWLYGRSLSTGVGEHFIVTERGVFSWHRWSVPLARIQSVGLSANPFQRRLGLTDLRLDVAGASTGVTIPDIGISRAIEVIAATRVCPTPDMLDVVNTPSWRLADEITR